MTVRSLSKAATAAKAAALRPAAVRAMKQTPLQRTARKIVLAYTTAADTAAAAMLQAVRDMVKRKKVTEAQWNDTYKPAFAEALAAAPTISDGSAKVMLTWLKSAVIGISHGIDGNREKPVASLQTYYRTKSPQVIKAGLMVKSKAGRKPRVTGTNAKPGSASPKSKPQVGKVMTIADMDATAGEYLSNMGAFATIGKADAYKPADRAAIAQLLSSKTRNGELVSWLLTFRK